MFFDDRDYYQRLGVSPNASGKEIGRGYKKLMMENHPDRFKGLRAKYEAEDDEVLLAVLEEKIRQAEETCKLINKAYKVLSDPALRKAYDEETYEPKVSAPEIVVSPTRISFRTLNEGQRKSKSFTIKNKGGPVATVEINWEDDPDWGELIIEPDPEETFPIKVAIKVDTKDISSGSKNQRILVVVDGAVYTVEVSLSVATVCKSAPMRAGTTSPPPSVAAVSHSTASPGGGPVKSCAGFVGGLVVWAVIVVLTGNCWLLSSVAEQRPGEQRQQEILENYPVKIAEAKRIRCGDVDVFEGKVKKIAEREGLSDTICIVFTVTNEWEDWAKVELIEDSGIHANFNYIFLSIREDLGYRYLCESLDNIGANETETYICFENENNIVDSLCLNVELNVSEYNGLLQKTVCSDVISIR